MKVCYVYLATGKVGGSCSRFVHILIHLGVVEERVVSPREGFATHVQIGVRRSLWQLATVLVFDVFLMRGVFSFDLEDPSDR